MNEVHVGLTERLWRVQNELEVFMPIMAGATRDQIAERFRIAISTVDTHVRAIHEKANTRNYSEFFARYFMPLSDV